MAHTVIAQPILAPTNASLCRPFNHFWQPVRDLSDPVPTLSQKNAELVSTPAQG